jgi:hypothetical protein
MNYLDLLPNDVMKIINRKVEDLHIISRKKERKENKKINMEQKRIADYKRSIYNKYVSLYEKHIRNIKLENCKKMTKEIKKEFGLAHFLRAEAVVNVRYPFLNVWILVDSNIYIMKFYDFFKRKHIKMEYKCKYCYYKNFKIIHKEREIYLY